MKFRLGRQTTRAWPGAVAHGAGLALVTAVVYAALAPVAYRVNGGSGLTAAALGAGICVVGAIAGWLLAKRLAGPVSGVLAGMLLRMGVPLAFCLILHWRGGTLADAGIVLYVLVFYLATLAFETWMALGPAGVANTSSGDL